MITKDKPTAPISYDEQVTQAISYYFNMTTFPVA